MAVEPSTVITVRRYRPEDHSQVTRIYVEGLMAADPNPEYRHLWEELLRKDLTNDLADIEGSHMAPGGNFFVAAAAKGGSDEMAGIIGLQRESNAVGQIRRVYVNPTFQRMGVGRKMIAKVERWAKKNGIKTLYLTSILRCARLQQS
ncbi:Acetyltransferase (GNAT) family [Phytophthora infestans]|uniref:Acetyltransferase (GNAT) family n=1 Tax=Phytophthora infestans TaxID=4787 RepID=A0A8S9UUG5_PHYIN|nr:Acetyltransferase (GNAT) family [Phytophthora infestans]